MRSDSNFVFCAEEEITTGFIASLRRISPGEGGETIADRCPHGARPHAHQLVERRAHGMCRLKAHRVIARCAITRHQHGFGASFHSQSRKQRFLHAAQTFDGNHLLAVKLPGGGIDDLPACDYGHAPGSVHGRDCRRLELGIVGHMGFQGARRTDGCARSAADALLGRYDQIVIRDGNGTRSARLRTAGTRCTTIAYNNAPLAMHRNIGTLYLFEQLVSVRNGNHVCLPSRRDGLQPHREVYTFQLDQRYPAPRTVSRCWETSGPSFARRRRTWTSTVREPP